MNQKQFSPLERSEEEHTVGAVRTIRPLLARKATLLAIVSLGVIIGTLLFPSVVSAQARPAIFNSPASPQSLMQSGSASAPSQGAAAATVNRTNWAGYRATGSQGTYRQANVEFHVPSIPNIQPGHFVSIWSGLGGGLNGATLVQAGVTVSRGSDGKQHNTAWWEVSGVSQQSFHFASLHAGDDIAVKVFSNLANSGQDTFFVHDKTSGESHIKTLAGHISSGAAGECIVERPGANNMLTELADFGTVRLTGCFMKKQQVATLKPVGFWPHTEIIMANGGHNLAVPGSLSDGSFTVTWVASN